VVNPLPAINPNRIDPFTVCSDNTQTGEVTVDLAIATELLDPSLDINDFTIRHFNTLAQAQANDDFGVVVPPFDVDELDGSDSNDPVLGLDTVDTVYVRIENNTTGCFTIVTVTIEVEESPINVADPIDLSACATDVGPNGIVDQNSFTFDLTVNSATVLGFDPNDPTDPNFDADLTIDYYLKMLLLEILILL